MSRRPGHQQGVPPFGGCHLNEPDSDHRGWLAAEEGRLLASGMRSALIAAALGGLIMLSVVWGRVETATALAWLFVHLLVLGLRYLDLSRIERLAQLVGKGDRNRLLLGVFATGVTWGAAGVVFFSADDPLRQLLLGLLLVAVVGGGVSLHISSQIATAAFVLPVLSPISLQYLFHPGSQNHALGAAGLLLAWVIVLAARRLGSYIVENHALRLAVEANSRKLLESQQKLALHIEHTPLGVIDWDPDFRVIGWNAAAAKIFGYDAEQAMRLQIQDFAFAADVVELDAVIAELRVGKVGSGLLARNRRADSEAIHCEWFNTPLVTAAGELIGVTSMVQDVTAKIVTENALRSSEARFRNLVERSLAGVYVIRNGVFSYVNPMLARVFGYRPGEIIDRKSVADLVVPRDRAKVLENIRRRLDGELDSLRYQFRGQRKDGSVVHVEVIGTRAELDGESVVLGTLLDVTEAVQARDRIEHLANFDALTDLPNRHSVSVAADRLIAEAIEREEEMICLYIDLDHFKNVNDTLGHDIGDLLLKDAGQRMRRCLREQDILARMGGDEFTVLLPQLDREAAATAARRIIRTLSEPFSIKGKLLRVGASVGAAQLEPGIVSFTELWKRADIAMYRAKRSRGTFAFFDTTQEAELSIRVQLENDLEAAIANGELRLHYQPRVDLQNGHCPSVEALVRWQHPALGWVSPGEFVPVAEASGLIHRLGDWVLGEACRQLLVWREQGIELRVAVNLSVVELQHHETVERVRAMLDRLQIEPAWLEFEITESAAMEEPEKTVDIVSSFRLLGITISIDDFGTGYSSLNYLKRIPAHHLKIDQSFVNGIDENAEFEHDSADRDIIRAIIALANSLGMDTIAEGIERPEQQRFLLAQGCHLAQGYLIARPMPADAATQWLEERRAAAVL